MSKLCGSVIKSDIERTNQNNKLFERCVPTNNLEVSYGIRPVQTKYSKFSLGNKNENNYVSVTNTETYNTNKTFFPGTRQAPWSGFVSNIHTESILRNQIFAMQKADQREYVPSSNSDLYNDQIDGNTVSDTHGLLFKNYINENNAAVLDVNMKELTKTQNVFYNSTRNDIK